MDSVDFSPIPHESVTEPWSIDVSCPPFYAPTVPEPHPNQLLIRLVLAGHRLTLNAIVAKTPYNGAPKEVRGTIEIPCNGYITGKVGVNPKFLSDITSVFSDDMELRLYLPDGKEGDPNQCQQKKNFEKCLKRENSNRVMLEQQISQLPQEKFTAL